MYRLIAVDLDGTLLNSYGEVSQEDKNAIGYAIQNGVELIIASRKSSNCN